MKKFYLIAAVMMTAASMFAQDANNYWYIRGEFNNYTPDGQDQWALMDDVADEEEGTQGNPGVYTGTFDVPAGKFKFNLMNPDGNIFAPINSSFSYINVNVVFTDNVYKGTCSLAWDDYDENYFWINEDWAGGQITVSVDTYKKNNPTVEIYAFPAAGQDKSEYNEDYTLVPLNENGVIAFYWDSEDICDIWHNAGTATVTDAAGKVTELSLAVPGREGEVTIVDSNPYGIEVNVAALELTPGKYTLTIPAMFVDIELNDYELTNYNPEITEEFEIKESGVLSLDKETLSSSVFNLQGVKVSSDLNSLPKGLYIINGKKTIVR